MPGTRDITDEIIRLGREYVAEDPRRRVPMLAKAVQQPPGDAIAMPKTPETGPEIDEFAYLGMPSPPAPGTPGMPAFSPPDPRSVYAPVPLARLASRPGEAMETRVPEGFTLWDEGWRDPQGRPARSISPSLSEMLTDLGRNLRPHLGAGSLRR